MLSLRYGLSLISGLTRVYGQKFVRFLARPWRGIALIPWLSVERRRMTISHDLNEVYSAERIVTDELLSGRYVFAGRRVDIGERNPFSLPPPSLAWQESLFNFRWLVHLLNSPHEPERLCLERLLRAWITTPTSFYRLADNLMVQSERVETLVKHSNAFLPFIDKGLRSVFHAKLYSDIHQLHARTLMVHTVESLRGLIALLIAARAIAELKWLIGSLERQLDGRLNGLIIKTGGPADRNPDTLFSITLGLMQLNKLIVAQGDKPSKSLSIALDYCHRLLVTLRMGDGRLAMFHGAGVTDFDDVTFLGSQGFLLNLEPMQETLFGYARLDQGKVNVIIDVGGAPKFYHSANAHASLLALEITSGAKRFVVNCGRPVVDREVWQQSVRETRAHSSVTVNDISTSAFSPRLGIFGGGRGLLGRPNKMLCEFYDTGDGPMIRAAHEAYKPTLGLSLERRVQILFHGREIKGQDFFHQTQLKRHSDLKFEIRFHMSYQSKVSQTSDDPLIYIDLGEGEIWEFSCPDAVVTLEESVTVSALKVMRKTTQIVIRGEVRDTPRVIWFFRRHDLPV